MNAKRVAVPTGKATAAWGQGRPYPRTQRSASLGCHRDLREADELACNTRRQARSRSHKPRLASPGAAHGQVRLLGGGSDAVERALDAPTVRTGIVISGHGQPDGARIESLGWPVEPGYRCVGSRSAVLPQVWIRSDIERVPHPIYLKVSSESNHCSGRTTSYAALVRAAGEGSGQESIQSERFRRHPEVGWLESKAVPRDRELAVRIAAQGSLSQQSDGAINAEVDGPLPTSA